MKAMKAMKDMQDNLTKPRVLVIDDQASIRFLIARLLSRNFEVACARDVDDGLSRLAAFKPDVILMDVDMPGKNGIEGLQEILKLDLGVRVIVMTGSFLSADRDSFIALGADAFIPKPFATRELFDLVTRLAGGRSERRSPCAAEDPRHFPCELLDII
ncbi:MAG: response regulator [bacterium]